LRCTFSGWRRIIITRRGKERPCVIHNSRFDNHIKGLEG